MAPSDRPFTQDELHAIFERAAERQEAARRAEAASTAGLTLDDLQRIGAEAGIDPAHIAAAAAEVAGNYRTAEPDRQSRWPRRVHVERVLPGSVSDEAWEAMVAELNRSLGEVGVAGQVGRTREWVTVGSGGRRRSPAPVAVTLRPEGDHTRLRIEQSWEEIRRVPLILGSVLSVMTLLLGLVFLLGEPAALVIPALLGMLAALVVGGGGPALRTLARRRERRFEGVLDRLENVALRMAPEVTPVAASATAEPRLTLPEEDAHTSDAPSRRRTRA